MVLMKVSVEKEGKNVVKLALEVEADRAKKTYDQVCRQLGNRVKIPGFRPGKAPQKMVEDAIGVERIKIEALERLVPTLLQEAIVDEKLDVITEPQINSWEFELGEPLKLSASFEVRPEVKLGDYKQLQVKVPEAVLPTDAMDRALGSIAEGRSSLKNIDPRPIKKGDTVLMDFECRVAGELVEGGKAQGLLLEIKEGNFLEGFTEQLEGAEPGQSKEVKASFPENYRNSALAGKDAVFQVEIKELRERQTPAVDDELAKSVGQESLTQLKEALQARLEEEIKQEIEARKQRCVVEAVVERAEVDIPDTMIERECNLLLQQLKRYFESNGQSWEQFVAAPEYEALYKEKKEEAQQRVMTSLVLGAVVRAESMAVTEEESQPYLAELVARYNVPLEQLATDENLQRSFMELRRQAMEEALTRKVVDFLIANSSLEFIPDEKKDENAGKETKKEAKKAAQKESE